MGSGGPVPNKPLHNASDSATTLAPFRPSKGHKRSARNGKDLLSDLEATVRQARAQPLHRFPPSFVKPECLFCNKIMFLGTSFPQH